MTPTELQNFKARYIAAHWGQKVFIDGSHELVINVCVFDDNYFAIKTNHLLLTPLSKITDNDLEKLARIEYQLMSEEWSSKERIEAAKYCIDNYASIEQMLPSETADFLRSRGYAIPFDGKSVEELIDMGLLKLRE